MLKRIYDSFFKEKWTFYTYMLALSALLVVGQLLVVCYINLTQMPYHLGYDATSNILKAAQIWEQGSIFPAAWVDQNILLFDSAALPAALIYGICGDLLTAYGVANILMTVCLVLCVWGLAKSLGMTPLSSLITLVMFLCPYVSGAFSNVNDLGYVSMLFTSAGFYSVRIITSLLAVKTVIDIKNKRSARVCIPLAAAGVLLSALCGASSGMFLAVTVLAPLVLYIAIDAIAKNKPREILSPAMLFAVGSLVLSVAARMIVSRFVGFDSKDMSMSFIEPEKLFANAGNQIIGFMILIGAYTPMGKIGVMSGTGMCYLIGLVIFGICIVAVVCFAFALKKYLRNSAYLPFFVIVIFDFLLFTFVDTSYSQLIFEYRYLVFPFICVIFLIARYIDSLGDNTAFKKAGVLLLAGCMLVMTGTSDYRYLRGKNNYDVMSDIIVRTAEYDVNAAYVIAGEDDDTVVLAKNLRVLDLSREYKLLHTDYKEIVHWGDYTGRDDAALAGDENIVIAPAGEFDKLPDYMKNTYSLLFESGGYFVYHSDTNRFDLNHKVLRGANRELPDSPMLFAENGGITDTGSYLSNGAAGFCLSGSTQYTEAGTYDVTLNYRIHESSDEAPAQFAVFVDGWENIVGIETLDAKEGSVTISGVSLTNYCQFGCFVTESDGTVIEIYSVDIVSAEG